MGRVETFDEAANLQAVKRNEYTARVHADWAYGAAAHGGYIASVILKAVKHHFTNTLKSHKQPDTVFSHVEFLRQTAVGDIRVLIQDTKLSRGTSTVHVTIEQKDKACVVAYVTNTNHSRGGLSKNMNMSREIQDPPIDFAKLLDGTDPSWVRWDVPYNADALNKAVSNCLIAVPRSACSNDRLFNFWLRCANPAERWTTDKLGLAGDYFVPTAENFFPGSPHSVRGTIATAIDWSKHGHQEHAAWGSVRYYPTINMSFDIKRPFPEEGVEWLFVQLESRDLVNGRTDCSLVFWDQDYTLLAVSHQMWAGIDTSAGGLANNSFLGAANKSKL